MPQGDAGELRKLHAAQIEKLVIQGYIALLLLPYAAMNSRYVSNAAIYSTVIIVAVIKRASNLLEHFLNPLESGVRGIIPRSFDTSRC